VEGGPFPALEINLTKFDRLRQRGNSARSTTVNLLLLGLAHLIELYLTGDKLPQLAWKFLEQLQLPRDKFLALPWS
jgi:hypothetical protein